MKHQQYLHIEGTRVVGDPAVGQQEVPTALNPNPHPALVAEADNRLWQAAAKRWEDLAFLESLPNRNDSYADVLQGVQEICQELGIAMPPVYVLSKEDYEAFDSRDTSHPTTRDGHESPLGAIVKESDHPVPEIARKITINTILHEVGHSLGAHEDDALRPFSGVVDLVISQPSKDGQYIGYHNLGDRDVSSFSKHRFKLHEGFETVGAFLEEGFADWFRVRYKDRFIPPETSPGEWLEVPEHNIRFVANDQAAKTPLSDRMDASTALDVPTSYMSVFGYDSTGTLRYNFPFACVAAYGLQLLNDALQELQPGSPSLFDQMVAARKDPDKQAQVIRSINSILPNLKPGLYDTIRELHYGQVGDFRRGVQAIQTAIAQARTGQLSN